LRRTELEAGQYEVVVMGYALQTQYELTVTLVETLMELRPAQMLAIGQVQARRVLSYAPGCGGACLQRDSGVL
jgi:hypothetical protein